jgi:hypothetical protein
MNAQIETERENTNVLKSKKSTQLLDLDKYTLQFRPGIAFKEEQENRVGNLFTLSQNLMFEFSKKTTLKRQSPDK